MSKQLIVLNIIKTKWLVFEQIYPEREIKTQFWQVVSKNQILLGDIKWFNHWRQYAFFPQKDTIYNSTCLKDIKEFINKLMKEHKK